VGSDPQTDHTSGCLVCGAPLEYPSSGVPACCFYCGVEEHANAICTHGHFVCDDCHRGSANDLIERYCTAADSRAPIAMAVTLMRDPRLKMHGPEHHFLVPAVLLAAFCTATGRSDEERVKLLAKARRRAEQVPGGFCGFNGSCGAGIGTGIFLSLATGATPLARNQWGLANLMTSESLRAIASCGGPRCCKRTSFLAIEEARRFMARELGVRLPPEASPACEFADRNNECLAEACPYNP
jgi:hypothetical protein